MITTREKIKRWLLQSPTFTLKQNGPAKRIFSFIFFTACYPTTEQMIFRRGFRKKFPVQLHPDVEKSHIFHIVWTLPLEVIYSILYAAPLTGLFFYTPAPLLGEKKERKLRLDNNKRLFEVFSKPDQSAYHKFFAESKVWESDRPFSFLFDIAVDLYFEFADLIYDFKKEERWVNYALLELLLKQQKCVSDLVSDLEKIMELNVEKGKSKELINTMLDRLSCSQTLYSGLKEVFICTRADQPLRQQGLTLDEVSRLEMFLMAVHNIVMFSILVPFAALVVFCVGSDSIEYAYAYWFDSDARYYFVKYILAAGQMDEDSLFVYLNKDISEFTWGVREDKIEWTRYQRSRTADKLFDRWIEDTDWEKQERALDEYLKMRR